MNIAKVFKKVKNAVCKDKAKTLTTVNCVGVIVTAGVSFKSGMNVQKKIDDGTLEKKDIVKELIPVIGTVALTEFAGIRSYKTSAKSIADLTLGLNQVKQEYATIEKKMRESLGDEKTEEIKKEAMKDIQDEKIAATPDATGYFWFRDDFTGACFYTRETDIWKAWSKTVVRVKSGEQVALTDFYFDIDRKDQCGTFNSMIKEFGWDGNNIADRHLTMSTEGVTMMDNGYPCKMLSYPGSKPHMLLERRYSR